MVRYLINLLTALVVMMWTPAIVFAGVIAATGGNESPFAVPAALAIGSLIFSTMAGATTLALSIAKELKAKPDQALVAPWANAVAHMLGSWLAGSAAFIASMAGGAGVWTLLGAVLIASFVGSKYLEVQAQKLFPGYTPPSEPT